MAQSHGIIILMNAASFKILIPVVAARSERGAENQLCKMQVPQGLAEIYCSSGPVW